MSSSDACASLTLACGTTSRDSAVEWSRLRYRLAEEKRRINTNDLWIASIALAHGLPVVTHDDDFAVLGGLGGPDVIRV